MTMRPATVKRYGNLATVALLVVTLVMAGLAGFGYSGRATFAGVGAGAGHFSQVSAASVHVNAKPLPQAGEVSAQVTVTNAPTAYWLLPYTLSWSIAPVNITIGPTNTWMSVSVNDITGSGHCVQNHNCPLVANLSANALIATGVNDYSMTLTNANITADGYAGGILPSDQFLVQVWVALNNGVNNVTAGAARQPFLVPGNPIGGFVVPLSGSSLSTGNVTLAVNYTGSYIRGAQLTVYQGTTSAGKVVFSQGVFVPGSGLRVAIANVVWFAAVAGSYYEVLNITAPFGSFLFSQILTVIPAGTTVYQNTSSWSNESIWGGVAPGSVAAGLLVAGLIIGMIVALALGRAMWGGPKTSPAQAWQSKPTNECSVCHQTFATEAELKEHQKTAHGM
jgi:hypothetical protein